MPARQTGGAGKHWSFSQEEVETIPALRDALTHHDTYFFEGPSEDTTLTLVLDKLLENLSADLAEPVRLVYLEGKSLREAAAILGVDHKTVAARAKRGAAALKKYLLDSMWVASMLRPFIPKDELRDYEVEADDIRSILNNLGGRQDEQE